MRVGNGPSGIAHRRRLGLGRRTACPAPSRESIPEPTRVVETIDVGNGPAGIAYASGSIWVANTGDDTITRIDADSGKPTKTLTDRRDRARLRRRHALGEPEDGESGRAHRSGDGKIVQTIPVGNGPTGIAFGSGAAWVANSLDGTVSRIDPETNSVAAVIPVGERPDGGRRRLAAASG